MKFLRSGGYAASLWLAAVGLAGCAGGASPATGIGESPRALAARQPVVVVHPIAPAISHPRAPWIAPKAKSKDLLYISDAYSNAVYVYSYPDGTPMGMLTGFDEPQGECVDSNGNVFIADTEASEVLEYAHAGTTPIQTLKEPSEYPVDCSVDPYTENLAVSNYYSGVEVFTHASGTPTRYTDPVIGYYYFDGYDNSGNLFIDGIDPSGGFAKFAELPAGRSSFKNIPLDRTIHFPGGVQWDGTRIGLGDQFAGGWTAAAIYRVKITATGGRITGAVPLKDAGDVAQFWIYGRRVIAPDGGKGEVDIYRYPGGGLPLRKVTGSLADPVGSVISPAHHGKSAEVHW